MMLNAHVSTHVNFHIDIIHTLHYITLHYITLRYVTLHYITFTLHLHYITLQYITLHIYGRVYIYTYIHT